MNPLTRYLDPLPFIAVLRGITPEEIPDVGDALTSNGFRVLEVPLNSPRALESIRLLADQWGPESLVGAGTVIAVDDVARVRAAGGQVIVSPTTSESPAGSLMYDMVDQVWAAPTSVTARGCKLYADVLAGDRLIVGVNFGSDFTSTAGTFTIQWAAAGVFAIDLTP